MLGGPGSCKASRAAKAVHGRPWTVINFGYFRYLSLPELSISSGREELRKVSEEEGGKDLEEKLRQGHLLPQVTSVVLPKHPPDARPLAAWLTPILNILYRMRLLAL